MALMKEQIRKKNILNLIKYHAENNDAGFRAEAYEVARYFDSIGDYQLSEYILALLSDVNTFVPQGNSYDSPYLTRVNLNTSTLPLPTSIKNDIVGVINSINHNVGINKFLFEGHPGTGKTESVKQVARILERELYSVDFETVVDSKMGQTSKNIAAMFKELQQLPHPERVIVLFDEIDALALDRVNSNDIREMGRVTSSVLKGLDSLSDSILLFATTNLFSKFDPALTRRFDATVNFDRYTREDLLDISEYMLEDLLTKFKSLGRSKRLFRKIIDTMKTVPYPGELKNLIRTSLSFSDPNNEYDYLTKLYTSINKHNPEMKLSVLQSQGLTLREMEVLTGRSKSQIARELSE
jgi:Cdc6-like AAA superfamily ATPase